MNSGENAALHILVFCTGRIDRPRSGGELRVRHLCEELARRGHRVDVEALVARNHPAVEVWPVDGLRIRLRHALWLDLALLADRTGLVPATELPVWLAPMAGWAGRRMRRGGYDLVHFEMPWFAAWQGYVPRGTRTVYSAQNIEWVWWRGRLLSRRGGAMWRRRLFVHETHAIERADAAVGCAAFDCRWLLRCRRRLHEGRDAVELIANGYDARRIRPPSPEEREAARRQLGWSADERVVLLVASDTQPNREAARRVIELAPTLGEPTRLVIAGRVCGSLGDATGTRRVTLLGGVEDVVPLLHAADVALNPVMSGSGSNLKLIEALAAGLRVVTTRFGLRGFEELEPYLEVCAIEDFPRAIERTEPRTTVPPHVLERHAWSAIAGELEAFYRRVLSASPPHTARRAAALRP